VDPRRDDLGQGLVGQRAAQAGSRRVVVTHQASIPYCRDPARRTRFPGSTRILLPLVSWSCTRSNAQASFARVAGPQSY
jgi:hypothetical protein